MSLPPAGLLGDGLRQTLQQSRRRQRGRRLAGGTSAKPGSPNSSASGATDTVPVTSASRTTVPDSRDDMRCAAGQQDLVPDPQHRGRDTVIGRARPPRSRRGAASGRGQVGDQDLPPQQVKQRRQHRDRVTDSRAPPATARLGEHLQQRGRDPGADTGMAIAGQPAQVRRQHRVHRADPADTPNPPTRRPARSRRTPRRPPARSGHRPDIDHHTGAIAQPGEVVRGMPSALAALLPRQPERLRGEPHHHRDRSPAHHLVALQPGLVTDMVPVVRTTTAPRKCAGPGRKRTPEPEHPLETHIEHDDSGSPRRSPPGPAKTKLARPALTSATTPATDHHQCPRSPPEHDHNQP